MLILNKGYKFNNDINLNYGFKLFFLFVLNGRQVHE